MTDHKLETTLEFVRFVYNAGMQPLHFIDQSIEAIFDRPPALEKKPGCPNGFVWEGQTYRIVEQITEWHDYQRRGRMASNMRPVHAEAATQHGSWGVGRSSIPINGLPVSRSSR